MTDKDVALYLDAWFNRHAKDKRQDQNPIWRVLKSRLTELEYWRGHPKGDAAKGYIAQQATYARDRGDGYYEDYE